MSPRTAVDNTESISSSGRLADLVRESGTGTGLFENYDSFVLDV